MHLDQRHRLLIAVGGAAFVAAALASISPWQLTILASWDVCAALIMGLVWSFIPFLNAADTQRVATREDDSRAAVDLIVVLACLISLVGVVLGLAQAKHESAPLAGVLRAVAVGTVLLSWCTVQTLFTLRYAHLYYRESPGGLEFGDPGTPPEYGDFAYLAFTIGMTFQVSDTQITQHSIRRAVTRHALVSYIFGTVIVGVTINVVGSLVG